MNLIRERLKQTVDGGLFHNSREDTRRAALMINLCITHINELIIANNEMKIMIVNLEDRIKELEEKANET